MQVPWTHICISFNGNILFEVVQCKEAFKGKQVEITSSVLIASKCLTCTSHSLYNQNAYKHTHLSVQSSSSTFILAYLHTAMADNCKVGYESHTVPFQSRKENRKY